MRTLAILPVKRFDAAKQRLGGALAGGTRRALAQAMFTDVLSALRRSRALEQILVVTAEPVVDQIARGEGIRVLHDDREAGQSAAAVRGLAEARAGGFDRALLVPGDTPLLDAGELDDVLALAAGAGAAVVVVPDRHGDGTNALVLHPPHAIEPSFGPGSRARHEAAARAAGVELRVETVPTLAIDVDTPEDLEALEEALERRRGGASLTRGAVSQIRRLQARPVGV